MLETVFVHEYHERHHPWTATGEVAVPPSTSCVVLVPRLFAEALCRDKDPKDVTQAQAGFFLANLMGTGFMDQSSTFISGNISCLSTAPFYSLSSLKKNCSSIPSPILGSLYLSLIILYHLQ